MFDIPLVSCYRKINELEEAGLLKCVEKPLKANGKRVRKYKSQLIKVVLTFERGKLRIALDVSWRRTQHFEASWTKGLETDGLDVPIGGSIPMDKLPTKN